VHNITIEAAQAAIHAAVCEWARSLIIALPVYIFCLFLAAGFFAARIQTLGGVRPVSVPDSGTELP
jgi:hypothetical protein